MNKWIKPMGFLLIMILMCSVVARVAGRSETLAEYALKHPQTFASPDASSNPARTEGPADASSNPSRTEIPADVSPAPATTGASPTPVTATVSPAEDETLSSPVPTSRPFTALSPETEDSVHYQDGFFYQPLSDSVIARITGISYPVSETIASTLEQPTVNRISDSQQPAVSYEDLCYMNVLYCNFQGETETGELICNRKIADDLVEIFYELYRNEYRIGKIRLIDDYNGDDTASMEDNNTSCFNYRVVDGTSSLSKHALGFAIDINPFYNPYVIYNRDGNGETYISPKGSEVYADRSLDFPYKIDESDLCYRLFAEHGFIWGGNWNSSKDYQHFQKVVD